VIHVSVVNVFYIYWSVPQLRRQLSCSIGKLQATCMYKGQSHHIQHLSDLLATDHYWLFPEISITMRERRIPPDSESGGIPHLFRTSLSPHIGNA